MRVQNNIPRSAPIYVAPKPNAGTPAVIRVRNDGYEDIDQVLDVDILRRDLRSSKLGLGWEEFN